MRKTKIVITVGPSTDNLQTLKKLIRRGVNVFRLNFSHATHEYHKSIIDKIREASKQTQKEVAILQDISGPKIRISYLKEPIVLKVGDILTLCKYETSEQNKIVALSYPQIIDSLKKGEMIYFADGTIRAKIVEKADDFVKCEIIVAQTLHSKKGVNFPKSKLKIDAITHKDEKDLEFGAKNGVDIVALSFVSDANDIIKAKSILNKFGANPFIFAKIEKQEAIKNLNSILLQADGVMVARGDLGVELGVEKVPRLQKEIIYQANLLSKPTITATQMLTSMINSPYPTRAEISDIANAVLDGSDAVMLSDETTIGSYAIEAVEVLNDAIREAEKIYPYFKETSHISRDDSIAKAAVTLAKAIKPDAIICFSRSGKSALSISKFRPKERILVSSYDINTLRKLQVVWGIDSIFLSSKSNDTNKLLKDFFETAIKNKHISIEKQYVLTIGSPLDVKHSANDIKLIEKETMQYILGYQ